ncbi:MAG: sugar transferase [Myxococcales bacterium]|nr:sugar transferase [Myxococcales bacterium]MDH3485714.1 sugar transferase [Myxococcales bacterium]
MGKRALDLGLAVPALVVLAPLGLVVGTLIRMKLGGPVLFRQPRPGQNDRLFELIKFRTMSTARDADGTLLPDEERLTPFGRRLRRMSLDELPTLWNVVRGDMSLVGPRPLLVQYLDRYTPEQRRRHEVAPGITGWAQIHGRNAISWEEKFELDVWYVENLSLRTDLEIILRTAVQVLGQRGISADGHATMPEFEGSHEESAR